MQLTTEQIQLLPEPLSNIEGFSVRTVNALAAIGVLTLEDLLMLDPEKLHQIRNFGAKMRNGIYTTLAGIGFHREKRGPQGE